VNAHLPTSLSEGITRRHLLQAGGVVSLGALIAACGSSGSEDPGRLGVAPPPATLPDAPIDNLALLRTAQSLEHTALALHQAIVDTGALTADESPLVERLIADHTAHAALIGELITRLGGEPFECANPFLADRVLNPIVEQFATSDDVHRDVVLVAQAAESWLGASHQSLIGQFVIEEPEEQSGSAESSSTAAPAPTVDATTLGELRRAIAQVGAEDQRHAVVLARLINDDTFSPAFFGDPVERDGQGFWIPYAIPSTFGRVAGIDLVIGAPNDEGARFAIQLQTPAANAVIYNYQSC
jgi:hypothetical protein